MSPWCGKRGGQALGNRASQGQIGAGETLWMWNESLDKKKSHFTALVLYAIIIIALLLSQHRFTFRKSKFLSNWTESFSVSKKS